jgi:hypothetical protein
MLFFDLIFKSYKLCLIYRCATSAGNRVRRIRPNQDRIEGFLRVINGPWLSTAVDWCVKDGRSLSKSERTRFVTT